MAYHNSDGAWLELKGKIKTKFAKLTDDDIEAIKGNLGQLAGKLQKTYGYAKDEAERQFQDFKKTFQTSFDNVVNQVSDKINTKIEAVNSKVDKVNQKLANPSSSKKVG